MVTSLLSRAPRSLASLSLLTALVAPSAARAQSPVDPTGTRPAPTASAAPPAAPSASAPPARAPASVPLTAVVIVPAEPRLHHAPPSTAFAGEPLTIEARVDFADRVRHAWLIYRVGDAAPQVAEFRRSTEGAYAAVTAPLAAPTLAYCIELEMADGERRAEFASRDAMHEVQVREPEARRREQETLARLGGRRSVVTTSMEFVRFGTTDTTVTAADGTTSRTSLVDQYYRIEAGYTYRLLGSVVAEFSLRGGVVRGRSQVPGATSSSKNDVGLNYGAPTLRLRLDDVLHVEGTLLTSVTEVGFSSGGGAAVLIGDPYGGKLTLGFESIATFGTRFYSRLDLIVAGRVGVAPMVEVTNMPHSSKYGVRLITEVGLPLGGGFRAAARVGYQARDSDSGGPSGGLSLAYAF